MIAVPAAASSRRVRRVVRPLVAQAAATPGADHYRKHFTAHAHLQILLDHIARGSASLRQTHARHAEGGWKRVGLDRPVSRSQLARSSTSRDPACAERLLAALTAELHRRAGTDPLTRRLAKIQLVDSTFIPLSLTLCPWSRHGRHPAGVRIQLGLDLAADDVAGPATWAGAVPSSLHMTLADTHDTREWLRRDLTELVGWTVIFDLGYYGHPYLARLRDAGVSFVCPLHPQATVLVTATHPIPPEDRAIPTTRDRVVADETILLGSPNHRGSTVVDQIRLVTGRSADGAVRRFLTDRVDLPAAEVLRLYRRRWQIELFFRWFKHTLDAASPIGRSRAAVWLTVVLAACVALLALLTQPFLPATVSRVAWLRAWAPALVLGPDTS